MANLNKIMLIGNVGRIETKAFQDGKVVNASLAVSERYTRRDGEQVDDTTWFNLVVNGKLAEVFEKWVEKGDRLYVEGRLRERRYTGRDGSDRSVWEVMVHQMQMLSQKVREDGASEKAQPAQDKVEEDLPY
ncbi:MAG: single-stranded DNA-binding protein [Clostridia bacterium]|nr:single-stranded DNA-binding protein [Clostridia bacterium]